MKALIWSGHTGSYLSLSDNTTHPIRDISEDDVLGIMRAILDGSETVEFDPVPKHPDGADPAAFVIYEELHKQFSDMVSRREEIISAVDKKFEKVKSYYSQKDIPDLFSDEGTETL